MFFEIDVKTPSSSLVRTQAFQACSAGSNLAGVVNIKGVPLPGAPFFVEEDDAL